MVQTKLRNGSKHMNGAQRILQQKPTTWNASPSCIHTDVSQISCIQTLENSVLTAQTFLDVANCTRNKKACQV
jgi:hypothetical protein